MRLSQFILQNMESILVEWEAFAATQFPETAQMDSLALRDHAHEILEAVATDLNTTQSREVQAQKSKGQIPQLIGAPETAAQTHAILRAKSGLDINQLAAEYRALRASVLRLWLDEFGADEFHRDDMIRFNEAIDQALTESIRFFSAHVERARNLLLGMLGHDMRSPLHTILNTATYLSELNVEPKISEAASRLIRSGASMKALLDDLVDFNRTNLGLGLIVDLKKGDLATICRDELEQLRGAHPGRPIDFHSEGNTDGNWDGNRVQQLVRNLVSNAIKYGSRDSVVHVRVYGDNEPRIEVINSGLPMAASHLNQMFEPLTRGFVQDEPHTDGGLGLGLFIVREVARSHGGDVEVRSVNGETIFTVRLPRDKTVEKKSGLAKPR